MITNKESALQGAKTKARIVDYIALHIKAHGQSPTVSEIAKGVGAKSQGTVKFHLDTLRSQGKVTWTHGKARTIRLTTHGSETAQRDRTVAKCAIARGDMAGALAIVGDADMVAGVVQALRDVGYMVAEREAA